MRRLLLVPLLAALLLLLLAAAASAAPLAAPWNGQPISPGIGPTYGEPWPVPVPSDEAVVNLQGSPHDSSTLAVMPYADVAPELAKFQAEAKAAGIPARMTWYVSGQSAGGRDMYAVVINDTETGAQQSAYQRWQNLRSKELINPAVAQTLLAAWGDKVKMPIFIEADINGNEYEGTDAMMQVIRDLTTTPYGQNETVDKLLDHCILVVVPTSNPDGRVIGIRGNVAVADTNRDYFLQSQPEEQIDSAIQQQYLATAALHLHGYVSPMLVDGDTKPLNPGTDAVNYYTWNTKRVTQTRADFSAAGFGLQTPVLDWNANGDTTPPPTGPSDAQTWDGWGPFYGQTYMEFLGVDSSTCEMSSNSTLEGPDGEQINGRLKAKVEQYLDFYSAADYWLDNRLAMMQDQLAMFRRGVENAPTNPNAFADSAYLTGLGFTDAANNWMIQYPTAYIIPFGMGQRSDAEANRLVEWLLHNGIQVERAQKAFSWNGTAYGAGSYVVSMSQALRGLAWNALAPGTDIESGIDVLYASPAAWSHGLLWGADTVEVPRGDTSFRPMTKPVSAVNSLSGGIVGGVKARADYYAVTLKGVHQDQAILAVLRGGIAGEMAEAPFASLSGGQLPAGSLIFPADQTTAAALDAAGKSSGMRVERVATAALPQTTKVGEAPRVAILTTNGTPTRTVGPTTYFTGADTDGVLDILFGADNVAYVGTTGGANPLSDPTIADPLDGFDVIYNAGASWPSNATAQARLTAFFAGGGGYIGTNVSTRNFSFLVDAGLVSGSLTQGSQSAYGGIAQWINAGGAGSPISGAYPGIDYMFLPSNTTYFTALPDGAQVDGQYPHTIATVGPQNGYVAGMWLNRDAAANSAPVLIHGDTTADSRYVAYATNPFSRYDAEREWPLIVQAALWSDQTDD